MVCPLFSLPSTQRVLTSNRSVGSGSIGVTDRPRTTSAYSEPMDEISSVLGELADAESRLAGSVGRLVGHDLREASLLPGWTQAHVLVHLARNADGLRNLLLAARTGASLRMYASPTTRAADIDAGVGRPSDVILDDTLESSRRFLVEARAMPDDSWEAIVAFTSGGLNPPLVTAARIIRLRLGEVEIHHADLGTSYGFADTPTSLAVRLIEDFAKIRTDQGVPLLFELVDIDRRISTTETIDAPVIRGSTAATLGWLAMPTRRLKRA